MNFFKKPLLKSRTDQKVCGICGGISKSIGIDSSWIRLIWLCSIIFWGTGLFVYIILAIALSYEPELEKYNEEQPIDVEYKES